MYRGLLATALIHQKATALPSIGMELAWKENCERWREDIRREAQREEEKKREIVGINSNNFTMLAALLFSSTIESYAMRADFK